MSLVTSASEIDHEWDYEVWLTQQVRQRKHKTSAQLTVFSCVISGVPALFVAVWAIVRATLADARWENKPRCVLKLSRQKKKKKKEKKEKCKEVDESKGQTWIQTQ